VSSPTKADLGEWLKKHGRDRFVVIRGGKPVSFAVADCNKNAPLGPSSLELKQVVRDFMTC